MSAATPPRAPRASAALVAAPGLVGALMREAHRADVSGRRELARQRYESALYLLRDHADAGTASTILRKVGRTFLDDGDYTTGMDCLEAALAVAEANRNAGEIGHTLNAMAVGHVQRGQLEDAAPLYREAARMGTIAGDERLVAMVEQNLGVVAAIHGDVYRAFAHFNASLQRYRALGLDEEVARLLNNLGMTYANLGRFDEAEAVYAESRQLALQCGDACIRLRVDVNHVELLIARRQFESARVLCHRIFSDAAAMNETRLQAETYKHCGVIARETRQLGEAESFFEMAFAQATVRQDLLLAAETAREQAELFLVLGRNRDTLQALSAAHRLFTKLQAQRELKDVSRRLRRLEQRFEDLVQKWAQDIESKDAYTLGHCERVADFACAIATDLGYDETMTFWFRVGALLHDVGKIIVASEILNKPGPLTPDERREMEKHPVAGVELLRDVDFPGDVIPMVRGHHERWDGHGYPDRLSGEDIPLAARILCVADVYDALTSERPYRRAFEARDALRLMQADSGRHFDPDILRRFTRILETVPAASSESRASERHLTLETPTRTRAIGGSRR